jgi:hypothetical protein
MTKGVVYCLSNPSFKSNIYKIGKTKFIDDPYQRIDLLDKTGNPTPFKIEFYIEVDDMDIVERQYHEDLKMYRIRNTREFFLVNILHIKKMFKLTTGKIINKFKQDEILPKNLFIVKQIKNHTKNLPVKETKYEVKWKGYKETTWEPYNNLKHLPILFEYIVTHQL